MKNILIIAGLTGLSMIVSSQAALLAEWDTTGFGGTETSISSENVASNLSVTAIGIGSELTTTSGGGGMNTSSWGNQLNSTSGNYYGFSVTVATGYELTLSDFNFTARSSNTGPGNFTMRFSGDSFASDIDTFSTSGDAYGDFSVDLSSLGTLSAGTYEFRIGLLNITQSDGVGDVSSSGTHRIMNPGSTGSSAVGANAINLNGTVTPVASIPEPAASLLGVIGIGAMALRRRR